MTEASKVYCHACGAMAVADAEWCGQCYAPLVERRSRGVAPRWAGAMLEAPPRPDVPTFQIDGKGHGGGAAVPAAPTNGHGETRRPTWPCVVCQAENDLSLDACAVCGSPFGRMFEEARSGAPVDARGAVIRSLIFPGLGHIGTGRGGDGVARAILFLWTLGTGLLLLLSANEASGSAPKVAGLVFLAAGLFLYALTALDAQRAAQGYSPLLAPKALLFGTVGMIALSIISLFAMVTRTANGP